MIASVRGLVLSALGSTAVIEVGGVGLALQVTPATALTLRVGTEARLSTTLIVREDSLTLYGFPATDELEVFELLVGVTGVGPKSALGVLAVLSPNRIAQAVASEDDAAFRKVSGIGPKTAKLIVLSLAGKVFVSAAAATAAARPAPTSASANVQAALIGLGWSERVAAQAVEETLADTADPEQVGVASLLRLVLARLGPAQQASERRS
ncbi:Holliday junction branch migration protein RuvA [Cryobacterium sp. TMT1-21]|uniref:Holliday junction branch migration complex subunit RuvA n=1 Tax=Cryobacterium shii TaxID=1259235 RepID=A0AAQ2HGE2_9MICO|nr:MULTISPECIES: Holliday junction branch migration protein RuvA [Cryobacterium]TFC51684.1 Holliday junction branch migration protein RuvA [Cryobacterium shii]TFD13651.1 Holliday junction branch migration protein RuvA [Cryobacterium sp. TMT4-10]TFD15986.1 Holliday junction branch migration protein RuvA [Cryobacterium sp. TMT1-21]TFD27077.1 Holliday junction branch migration protein RuvA [Cryobacterium sp. TMT2-23]TFD38287.1 Holliday junction branch migration protein RuvA [Cryobacterium sp. TMT